jgi:hypothetical protein
MPLPAGTYARDRQINPPEVLRVWPVFAIADSQDPCALTADGDQSLLIGGTSWVTELVHAGTDPWSLVDRWTPTRNETPPTP